MVGGQRFGLSVGSWHSGTLTDFGEMPGDEGDVGEVSSVGTRAVDGGQAWKDEPWQGAVGSFEGERTAVYIDKANVRFPVSTTLLSRGM